MILVVISSFFIRHYNHVPLIGIHDISALVWQEKLFSPPFFLLLMLVRQMTQTWILVIIFILFVIRHYNHFFLLGTWYWCFSLARKTFFPLFSIELTFIMNRTNLDALNNLCSFCYCHSNCVQLLGTHDIDALIRQEKLFFAPFSLELKFIVNGDKLGYS